MNRSIIVSSVLHGLLILITAMSLPFLAKKPNTKNKRKKKKINNKAHKKKNNSKRNNR
jgi:hypothetical protein